MLRLKLENPETFINVTSSVTTLDGKTKDNKETVTSKPINTWFNPVFPLPNNPEEAKKTLINLTLGVGEIKEFDEAEAKYLMSTFPWLKETDKPVQAGKPVIVEVTKARPSRDLEINENLD
jgi:hypothetical protein